MGIIMKFLVVVTTVAAWTLPNCESWFNDAGNGEGQGYNGSCGGGSVRKQACCEAGGALSAIGDNICRNSVNACSGRRMMLKEEDDFDSLDDLELEESASHGL